MAWKVTIAEKSMLLDDLSENDFVAATQNHPDVSWLRLYVSPAANPTAFYDLLCACALRLGVPAPERPQTIKESVKLIEHIEQIDDDLPTAFDDGGIPLEDTADATVTTLSSTSTGQESGRPNKHERRP